MKSTNEKPTKPGYYWYRDEVCGQVAAEVFFGDKSYFGEDNLLAYVPVYNYTPQVSELDGEWSDDQIPAPPWPQTPILNWATGKDERETAP